MAKKDEAERAEGAQRSDVRDDDLGRPYPEPVRQLAKDLPEKDEVQEAYKAQFLADDQQSEVKEKMTVVEASPNSPDTPSGYALQKVAGVSNDAERGDEYARHKMARRWGYVPADES